MRARICGRIPTASRGRGGQRGHAVRRRLAGKYDLSMICVAATNPFGYDALAANWQIANDIAAEQGRRMDPARLRLVGPMHIAETRDKAFENCRFGFERYLGYLNNNQPRFIVPRRTGSRRMVRREQVRRDRHAGRRDRADRAAAGEAGRVRRVPASGAQLGRLGGDQAILRALRPLRDAAFLATTTCRASSRSTGAPSIATNSPRSAPPRRARCSTSTRRNSARRARRRRWCGRRRDARRGDAMSAVDPRGA